MTAFAIKLVAVCTMLVDHTARLLGEVQPITPQTYNLLHGIGRIAFPLYAFLAVLGWKNTHNAKRYFLRMTTAAFIAQIPFTAFMQSLKLNVIVTLSFSLLMLAAYDKIKKDRRDKKAWAAVGGVLLVTLLIPMDFGLWGVALVFLLYICKSPVQILCTIGIWAFCKYALFSGAGWQNPAALQWVLYCVAAGALAASYSGKQGYRCKWLFYAVYPVHLAILALLRFWLVQ
ncbi:MAG: TraX family protein [Oscillospiraceae bacterium]|nr:TraX family protein [Oscillospiraceae bacterium]